eukprot:6183489-Prymnesium_polylepis.2
MTAVESAQRPLSKLSLELSYTITETTARRGGRRSMFARRRGVFVCVRAVSKTVSSGAQASFLQRSVEPPSSGGGHVAAARCDPTCRNSHP